MPGWAQLPQTRELSRRAHLGQGHAFSNTPRQENMFPEGQALPFLPVPSHSLFREHERESCPGTQGVKPWGEELDDTLGSSLGSQSTKQSKFFLASFSSKPSMYEIFLENTNMVYYASQRLN